MKRRERKFLHLGLCAAWAALAAPLAYAQDNGIAVSGIKVYDNAALQQMLDNARARLAGMSFLDASVIASHIGGIQGSTMQQSGFSVNVGGPPIAGLQTTANTGNTVTTQSQGTSSNSNSGTSNNQTQSTTGGTSGPTSSNQLTVTTPTTSSGTTGNNQTQVTGPSTQTLATLAQQNPSAPALPTTNSFTAPSTFAPSASNILNEQVQLTSEVAGLALLLEGAISDQAVQKTLGKDVLTLPKRRVTIGIPVSIVPSEEDKDAVAEVIVTITPPAGGLFDDAPAITAILPQDKTYNVATITGKSFNVGGGVVTGMMTAGVNFLWQKQTYYVVQAQDTVALQLPPDPTASEVIRFGWQLRPVLGARTVSSGMRTLFVQLAFPPPVDAAGVHHLFQDYGTVTVTTGWKKIDHKFNTVSTSVERTGTSGPFSIKDFNLEPQIVTVSPLDNGDGSVTVHLDSLSYLQNTYIKIAGATISQGAANVLFSPTSIDFAAPAVVLATQRAYLVDRSGANREIVDPRIGSVTDFECLHITSNPTVAPESPTTGRLTLRVVRVDGPHCPDTDGGPTLRGLHLVALVGSKVFGLRDAPITVDDVHSTISFRAPMDLLRSVATVTIEKLLWGEPYKVSADLGVNTVPMIDKATVIAKGKDNLEIALMGSNLQHLTPPGGMAFNADGKTCTLNAATPNDTSNTGRILCVPQSLAANLTEIALKADSGDLLLVELPAPAKPTVTTKPSGPTLDPQGSIDGGVATTLTVKGSKLDGFDYVEVGKTKIPAELSADKTLIAVHLPADLVKAPKVVLVFAFKGSKNVSYTVTVNKNVTAGTKP